jgi:ABC-type multidrug transport system permease subunit
MGNNIEDIQKAIFKDYLIGSNIGLIVTLLYAAYNYISVSEAVWLYVMFNICSIVFMFVSIFFRRMNQK